MFWNRSVDIPSGGLQDFHLGQGSTASSSGPADEALQWFFALFSGFKKKVAASAASPSPIVPASVSSSTRAAYEDLDSADEPLTQQDEEEELLFEEEEDPTGWIESQSALGRPFYWHRCSRRSLWHLPPGASSRRRKGRKKRKKRRKKKAPKSSSLRSSRGVRIRRCWQGFRSRSSLSGARVCSFPCSSFAWLVCWLRCCSRSVPFVVGRPEMLRIMAGTDQRYSYVVGWFFWCWTSSCVPLRCLQAQDACHHGWYGPERAVRGAVQKTADFPQLQFIVKSSIALLWCKGRFFMALTIQQTLVIPQLLLYMVVDAPGLQVVQISLSWRRGLSRGPDCSSDHRDSPVAHRHGGLCPCCACRASSTGPGQCSPVMQAVRVPQVVIIPIAAQRLTSMVSLTMEIPQLLLDEVVDVLLARVPQVPSWRRQLCSHSCTC